MVQKVQKVQRVVVSPYRAMSFVCRSAEWKTVQPRLTVSRLKGRPFYVQAMGQLRLTCTFSAECAQRAEMHPYPRLRRYFPRRGKFALHSASELISTSRHSAARISPFGGDAAAGGRRGAFPSPVRAVCLFSSGQSPVVWFSLRCCHKLRLIPSPSTHSAPE